jgi:hypothetical protein
MAIVSLSLNYEFLEFFTLPYNLLNKQILHRGHQ